MKARNNKLLSGLPLLLIVLLSTLGAAYAAWTDTIRVNLRAEMGSLTLAFDYKEPPSYVEYYLDPATGQLVEGEWEGKDVASGRAYCADLITDEHTGKKGYKRLIIEISNAYPCYHGHTTFILRNIGTVPIYIARFIITGEKRDSTGRKIYDLLWYDPDGDYIGDLYEDVNGNGIVDAGDIKVINLVITNDLPWQLDPCHRNKLEMDLHFKQEAEECHTYIITVEVVGVQWNKLDEYLGG